ISPIDKAVEDFKLQEPGEELLYTKFAEKYNVSKVTLAQRCQGKQAPKKAQAVNQQQLNPQQELELVEYIRGLTKKGLLPTREMVQNFASQIVKEPV
ncbi:hypothetical protein EJ02DRAFT_325838, partial [Clathrospora elynae]